MKKAYKKPEIRIAMTAMAAMLCYSGGFNAPEYVPAEDGE